MKECDDLKQFLNYYHNPNEERINMGLLTREYDDSLINYIADCCRSLEVVPYIKFLGYELITNEADIDTAEYIDAKSRNRSKRGESTKYMYIQENRNAEMRLKFFLDCNGESETITKKILIPIADEQGYYTVKGSKYYLLYQIVDNSTYTTKKNLTLKSMMPVVIRRKQFTAKDSDGNQYNAPIYTINIFRKDANILLFYLAKLGIVRTLKYFSVDTIINFTTEPIDCMAYLYFPINSKLFIEVNKEFFTKYMYVRSMVCMLLAVTTNRLTIENLFNKHFWIESIGSMGTINKHAQYEKGLNTLTFFDRIIDDTTKKILKLNPIHTKNTYSIVRWLVQNFESLRRKDNFDLANKRLRCNEYIASLLTKTFSERINRIISMGSKATIMNVKEIFKFQGDILLTQLHKSGLKFLSPSTVMYLQKLF